MQSLKEHGHRWLRWSERYTKTDMVYLASGGFWLTLGQVISSLSSFLLALAFANLLPPEVFGTYKYLLSTISTLTIFTLSGVSLSVVQAVSRGYEGDMMAGFKTRVKWGLLGSLSSIGIAAYYYLHSNLTLTLAFGLIAIFLPITEPLGIYDSLLQGKKLFNRSTQYFSLTQIFTAAMMAAVLLVTNELWALILTYFLSRIVIRLIFFVITRRHFVSNQDRDPETSSYGRHLSFISSIGSVVGNLNNILLFHFLGSQSLSIFSIALAPIEQVRAILKLLGGLIIPKAAVAPANSLPPQLFIRKISPFLTILSAGVLVYVVAAPTLFQILFPKYLSSVPYSQALAFTLLITMVDIWLLSILRARKAVRALYIFNVSDAICTTIITVPAIYYFQIWGLVASIALSKIAQAVVMWLFVFEETTQAETA
jgi:O-antigen/teichoic acid export membrane protein